MPSPLQMGPAAQALRDPTGAPMMGPMPPQGMPQQPPNQLQDPTNAPIMGPPAPAGSPPPQQMAQMLRGSDYQPPMGQQGGYFNDMPEYSKGSYGDPRAQYMPPPEVTPLPADEIIPADDTVVDEEPYVPPGSPTDPTVFNPDDYDGTIGTPVGEYGSQYGGSLDRLLNRVGWADYDGPRGGWNQETGEYEMSPEQKAWILRMQSEEAEIQDSNIAGGNNAAGGFGPRRQF